MMLRKHFFDALYPYEEEWRVKEMWTAIVTACSAPGRFYHTPVHLENMLIQLLGVRETIKEWDVMILGICYHDIVYDPLKNNNEEESAAWAAKDLSVISMPGAKKEQIAEVILATKKHEYQANPDINYFTDADLSVLGADENVYRQYAAAIRQEYIQIPDAQYIPGRIRVLELFLAMPSIFKTGRFTSLFEVKARKNLANERDLLKGA